MQEVDDADTWFVYSKDTEDSLPLTKFKVENKPCLDPNQQSRDVTQ